MQKIKGYEGLYSVTEDGFVFSHFNNKIALGDTNSGGYKRVLLCKKNKRKRFFVHRLVAEHFIPNHENKETVNHKGGNKYNNAVINLEWATASEQGKHAWKNGLSKVTPNFTQEVNRKIPKDGVIRLVSLHSQKQLNVSEEAKYFGVGKSGIYKAIYDYNNIQLQKGA